jgi:hypothetical protein
MQSREHVPATKRRFGISSADEGPSSTNASQLNYSWTDTRDSGKLGYTAYRAPKRPIGQLLASRYASTAA